MWGMVGTGAGVKSEKSAQVHPRSWRGEYVCDGFRKEVGTKWVMATSGTVAAFKVGEIHTYLPALTLRFPVI